MSTVLRLDRIQAVINAIKAFYASQTDAQAQKALAAVRRLTEKRHE